MLGVTSGCWESRTESGGVTLRCMAPQPHPDNITLRRRTGRPAAPPPVPLPQSLSLPFPRCRLLPPRPALSGGTVSHGGALLPSLGGTLMSLHPPTPLRPPRARLGSTPRHPPAPDPAFPAFPVATGMPPSRDAQDLPVFPHDSQHLPGNPSAPHDSQDLPVAPVTPSSSQYLPMLPARPSPYDSLVRTTPVPPSGPRDSQFFP